MSKIFIENLSPVTVYDVKQKKVMAIFKTGALCAKYIYADTGKTSAKTDVYGCLSRKGKTKFRNTKDWVALRYANEAQKELLGGEDYLIMEGYPPAEKNKMKGFTDTKGTFYKRHNVEHFNKTMNQ
jgi:hypothetical protein